MENVRKEWLTQLLRIVEAPLAALEAGELKKRLPTEFHPDRARYAPLEAFGRSMLGLAPWLELDGAKLSEEERRLQERWRARALRCLAAACDPASPDFLNFCEGDQPLVDAAFLAHALVRAPRALAGALPEDEREKLAAALRSSRRIPAYDCNWVLFSAMVEGGLHVLGEEYDVMRVLLALRALKSWYLGDGTYGDGPSFHWDYYNSFVIQPMLVDLTALFAPENAEIAALLPTVTAHASRYARVLERLIAPDGSYPIFGRSICYRFGAFQALAQAALQHRLGEGLSPASVRCGLTAVIRRVMASEALFDENGWLLPGVAGAQPELAEGYIGVGSLYLASAVFLPLGLSPDDPFWSAPDEDWTGKRVWSGQHAAIDHAED